MDNLHDKIAALLAENERLTAGLSVAKAIIQKLDTDRSQVYASGLSDGRNGTPCEAIRMQQEIDELRARAEAAEAELKAQVQCTLQALNQRQAVEARYAALCEAEPVVWQYRINRTYTGYLEVEPPDDAYDEGTLVALIPRPSMEKKS